MTGTYLDRAAWGANASLPRLGHVVPRERFNRIVVHHTVITFNGDVPAYMRALQTARPDLGRDVPYSFVVFPGAAPDDFVVCEGRGFDRTGAHTPGYNSTAYGVSFAGDFTNVAPTPGMVAGVRWVGAQLVSTPAETLGHRDTKPTACPGNAAYPLLPQMQPPFTTPDPGPPPAIDFGAIDMANVHTKLVPVGPLDPNGNGWNVVDFGFPVTRIIGVACNGPNPQTDGYWPLPRDVSAQMRGNGVVVTATQGWPGSTVNVWVSAG